MIRLEIKDKKLMKNKKVRAWLRKCEKKVNREIERQYIELMQFGGDCFFILSK